MSKWAKRAGHAQHLVAYPLHTVSQIPPYITCLFVHTTQTNKKKEVTSVALCLRYCRAYMHCKGLLSQHNRVWNSSQRMLGKASLNPTAALRRGLCHQLSIWMLWEEHLQHNPWQNVILLLISNPVGLYLTHWDNYKPASRAYRQ